ncbi:MAG: nicotinate-nucleotide adenylyltransferase [Chloroflexota bacterium]
MKTAILGGTFDPIHIGHLVIAEQAAHRLQLEQVLFIPAGNPRLKTNPSVIPAYHRLEMTRLAIAGNPRFRLSDMEVKRPGPTYTVDTVRQLKAETGEGRELFFIMGWDSLENIRSWKEPASLVKMCRLVTVPRVGYARPSLKTLEENIPGISEAVEFLDAPLIGVTSSDIRDGVTRGLSIRYLVPEAVERYILEQRLYRSQ